MPEAAPRDGQVRARYEWPSLPSCGPGPLAEHPGHHPRATHGHLESSNRQLLRRVQIASPPVEAPGCTVGADPSIVWVFATRRPAWSRSDGQVRPLQHAFLVIPIAMWLIWRAAEGTGCMRARPQPWALLLVAIACCSGSQAGWPVSTRPRTSALSPVSVVLSVPAVWLGRCTCADLPLTFFLRSPLAHVAVPDTPAVDCRRHRLCAACQWYPRVPRRRSVGHTVRQRSSDRGLVAAFATDRNP